MEYVDNNLQPISEELRTRFLSLKSFLSEQDKAGRLLFLFRGEEQRNIRRRLTSGGLGIETNEVFERAFYFGDKARHFSVDTFNTERNFLTGINDCSDETLLFIYRRICESLEDPRVLSQVNKNTSREFRDFFLNQHNQHDFLQRINQAYTSETKLKARDYFLYFLHIAGSAGIRKETMFVSTTTDRRIARGFSKAVNRNSSRIIFHYFIPQPFHVHAIAPWVADHHQRIVNALRLPTYKSTGLFPKQQEVSVKGALFPHFILGIELVDEKKFVINSNFNEYDNKLNFESVSRQGFFIDQSDFHSRIFDTGYIRWGQTDLAGNFESNDV
ncbi:hypothetical protein [Alkalimonas sp.]|uniref:hypothetical protein n=1 Tax=Alkalimonas sp. TaxID=1872453 RepID=UPI00263ADE06|nr:hypothetical protein [Alkalimonas sp.]MCC5824874.1 hypothetical protein [Alkalimonas sp.]